MQIVRVIQAGTGFSFQWPSGDVETYSTWVEYRARAEDGEHRIRIGFGKRPVWGQERERVVVWIDDYPHAEFFGADDFETSGEVLSDIWLRRADREVMCRYPDDAIPERYVPFSPVGLPTRVIAKGVRSSWAVVANVSDQNTMIALAALRRTERMQ